MALHFIGLTVIWRLSAMAKITITIEIEKLVSSYDQTLTSIAALYETVRRIRPKTPDFGGTLRDESGTFLITLGD